MVVKTVTTKVMEPTMYAGLLEHVKPTAHIDNLPEIKRISGEYGRVPPSSEYGHQ